MEKVNYSAQLAPRIKLDGAKEFEFTRRDFDRVRALIYRRAGISLNESKQEMVYSRLARRLRATGIVTFGEYLDHLETGRDPGEWEAFTNALTTNLTSFFRESHHFPVLAEHIRGKEQVSIWCAAASTGEEAWSIAMTACEAFGKTPAPVRIVASDIDTNVLATAEAGIYPADKLDKMSQERIKRFFLKGKGSQTGLVRIRPELQSMVTFRQINLLADVWDIAGPMDAIFCRNVMIYFDKPTQQRILNRFAPLLKPHGLLFAGHSENFLNVSDRFKLRSNTVYEMVAQGESRSSGLMHHHHG
jgi:chemotaxis protein methyltransferase CheR